MKAMVWPLRRGPVRVTLTDVAVEAASRDNVSNLSNVPISSLAAMFEESTGTSSLREVIGLVEFLTILYVSDTLIPPAVSNVTTRFNVETSICLIQPSGKLIEAFPGK